MEAIEKSVNAAASKHFESMQMPSSDDDRGELLIQPSPHVFQGVSTYRPFRDVHFGVVFVLCLLSVALTGIILAAKFASVPGSSYWFDVFAGSVGTLVLVFLIVVLGGALWLLAFRRTARMSTWFAVVVTPVLLFAAGVAIIAKEMSARGSCGSGPECASSSSSTLLLMGSTALVLSVVTSLAAYFWRTQIRDSIRVLQLACSVLQTHPQLVALSIVLTVVLVCFTVVWMYLFVWLFYLAEQDENGMYGQLNGGTFVAIAFFLLVYFWTAALIDYGSKFIISGVTSHWYFHRHDILRNRSNPMFTFLRLSATSSFGSLAFAALVLSSVQLLRYFVDHVLRRLSGASKLMACCCSGILHLLEALIAKVSAYSIARMAISGDGFCDSVGFIADMLPRAKMMAAINVLATTLLGMWNLAFAFVCGALAMAIGAVLNGSVSSTAAIVVFATAVAFCVMRFYTGMLTAIADTLLVCFLVETEVVSMTGSTDTDNGAINVVFSEAAAAKEAAMDHSIIYQPAQV